MKKLWLHSIRAYLKLGMFFYFKKVVVNNVENVPKNQPVLFLGNHQNALLDALLIAVHGPRFSFFLTRAGVFKKAFIGKLLKSLQMLPVYRIRDGWNNLTNNQVIFETCSELLKKGEAIVIFPEGNHNLERRVRTLSKGFTRIVFDTLEKYPEMDLQLVPVGVNYQDALNFPDSTALIFGKSIPAKNYTLNNKNESITSLKNRVQSELMELTIHIPLENYDSDLKKLNALQVDFLKPQEVNACIESGFVHCKQNGKPKKNSLKRFFKVLLIFSLIAPYAIWKLSIEPRVKELEFRSTFRFAIALTLVPIWVLLLAIILLIYFGWLITLGYLGITIILALLAIKL